MPSTYTPLGVELMVTGEKSGQWGTLTNTNWNLSEQIASGYKVQTLNTSGSGANTTTLAVTDGGTGATLATRIIILGAVSPEAITGNKIVTIPLDVENWYFIKNSTSGAYTVEFKYASGSGSSVTWTATSKDWKVIYAAADDGTNPNIVEVPLGMADIVDDTTPQLGGNLDVNGNSIVSVSDGNIALAPNGTGEVVIGSGTAAGDITTSGTQDLILDTNSGTNSGSITITDGVNGDITSAPNGTGKTVLYGNTNAGTLVFNCESNSHAITLKGAPHSAAATYTLILPSAQATASGQALVNDSAGQLSWTTIAGGLTWVVKTTTYTGVANDGIFADTSSAGWTLSLPAGTLGDEIGITDYAGTFDTNNLTVAPNGSEKIQGTAASLTVSVERAAFVLVYSGSAQGWLLKDN